MSNAATDSTHADTERPLCVDLDGTLLATDTMAEGFMGLLKSAPWKVPAALAALSTGRPRLKRYLAENAPVDPETLPYRPEVLDAIAKRARRADACCW